MEVVVDLSTKDVALRDGRDLKRLAVRVLSVPDDGDRGLGALIDLLEVSEVGSLDTDGDVLIPPAALRRLAADAAGAEGSDLDADWDAAFSAMLEGAAARGWLAEDGAVRAHLEWGS
jgi:hypothetical protein